MRRILITLGILIVLLIALSALWIWRGREISLFIDRFGTIEISSTRINSIVYEGSGSGGVLHVNNLALSLNDKNGPTPSIGTTLSVHRDRWGRILPLYRQQATMLLSKSAEPS